MVGVINPPVPLRSAIADCGRTGSKADCIRV